MLSSVEPYNLQLTSHCSSHALYPKEITRDEALLVQAPCISTGLNLVTCKNPHRDLFVQEVGGLGLDNIRVIKEGDVVLPNYIPIIHRGFFGFPSSCLSSKVVGVSVSDIFINTPKGKRSTGCWLNPIIDRQCLQKPIFKNKKVILFLSGKDFLIESIWQAQKEIDFFKQVSEMGFFKVCAFDFSVFFKECSLGQYINIRKSLVSFDHLQKLGVDAVPHFYWSNDFQLKKIINWLKKEDKLKLITINCQCFKALDYPVVIRGIEKILTQTNGLIKILLEGPQKEMLEGLKPLSRNILVSSKAPIMNALNFTSQSFDNENEIMIYKHKVALKKIEILPENIRAEEMYLKTKFWEKPAFGLTALQATAVLESFEKDDRFYKQPKEKTTQQILRSVHA